ncbi:hypothetical protein PR048_018556 [Dryococelus australis]|uniref:Uncharacterized protein n=1 Tax=Dryococelus australis TaxID=614101 RepID=A0ABQ9HDC0_9NEOP|nr:hypothetical protein PR048_018556 [Dryococelus australis]
MQQVRHRRITSLGRDSLNVGKGRGRGHGLFAFSVYLREGVRTGLASDWLPLAAVGSPIGWAAGRLVVFCDIRSLNRRAPSNNTCRFSSRPAGSFSGIVHPWSHPTFLKSRLSSTSRIFLRLVQTKLNYFQQTTPKGQRAAFVRTHGMDPRGNPESKVKKRRSHTGDTNTHRLVPHRPYAQGVQCFRRDATIYRRYCLYASDILPRRQQATGVRLSFCISRCRMHCETTPGMRRTFCTRTIRRVSKPCTKDCEVSIIFTARRVWHDDLSCGVHRRPAAQLQAASYLPSRCDRGHMSRNTPPCQVDLLVLVACSSAIRGATVAERLACSPPTKAIRVQSPAGSLRLVACGNRAGRCRWSAGFLGDLPFPPPFHSGAALYSSQSPSLALNTPMLRAV